MGWVVNIDIKHVDPVANRGVYVHLGVYLANVTYEHVVFMDKKVLIYYFAIKKIVCVTCGVNAVQGAVPWVASCYHFQLLKDMRDPLFLSSQLKGTWTGYIFT